MYRYNLSRRGTKTKISPVKGRCPQDGGVWKLSNPPVRLCQANFLPSQGGLICVLRGFDIE